MFHIKIMVPRKGSKNITETTRTVNIGDRNKTNVLDANDCAAGFVPPTVIRLLASDGLLGSNTSTERRYSSKLLGIVYIFKYITKTITTVKLYIFLQERVVFIF